MEIDWHLLRTPKQIDEDAWKCVTDLSNDNLEWYKSMLEKCQSPIEQQMMASFISHGMASAIHQQVPIGTYRVDFTLMSAGAFIVVECDGHEFHEKTKEQVERDNKRDRYLQQEGWRVFRFSGSEIHNDADKCVDEVLNAVYDVVEFNIRSTSPMEIQFLRKEAST